MRALDGGHRADGGMIGHRLPGKHHLAAGILRTLGRAAMLALFGQHNRGLGADIGFAQRWRDHHARKQAEALIQTGRGGIGQINAEHGVDRGGLGVGVGAKGGAQPLPGGNGLRLAQIARFTKHEMLDQMGKARLLRALVQRADIHADADRDLPRRHAILPHRPAQPIGQCAEKPLGIARHIGPAIQPRIALIGQRGQRRGARLRCCRSRRLPRIRPRHRRGQQRQRQQRGKNRPPSRKPERGGARQEREGRKWQGRGLHGQGRCHRQSYKGQAD